MTLFALPNTRHDATKLQLPIEAVKIWIDLAINTMYNNDGITDEDWEWFQDAVVRISGTVKKEVKI